MIYREVEIDKVDMENIGHGEIYPLILSGKHIIVAQHFNPDNWVSLKVEAKSILKGITHILLPANEVSFIEEHNKSIKCLRCIKCNYLNLDDAKFCGGCGQPIKGS